METSTRDWIAGVFLLAGLGAVAFLSVQLGGLSYKGPGGLSLLADFDEIGGLSERAPVVISGVKVGQVESIGLSEDLRARVVLEVDGRLALPVDSRAAIRTAGLLGDQFVSIEPGAEDVLLAPGDRFSFTDSALQLESLVGNLVHGTGIE